MRPGWMRPSSMRRSSASRATSRRTGSKQDSSTAPGVSSTIRSTPVAVSRARMLRPSRPMMRPFISSLGRSTTETVLSTTWSAATRWMASEMIRLARLLPSWVASSSMRRTILAASMRASFSMARISSCLACSEVSPATRSSWRAARPPAPPWRPPRARVGSPARRARCRSGIHLAGALVATARALVHAPWRAGRASAHGQQLLAILPCVPVELERAPSSFSRASMAGVPDPAARPPAPRRPAAVGASCLGLGRRLSVLPTCGALAASGGTSNHTLNRAKQRQSLQQR